MKNKGIILGSRKEDWIAGTIPYEVLNESGDWTEYLPPGEWQRINNKETMACVSFSALNVLETLYYFHTGERRNFSDRFTACMSGTMRRGNYLWKVGDSIRKDGIVDEEDWAVPDDMSWDSYYQTPPIKVIDKGKEFLKDWTINYEVIADSSRESLIHHLKQSPLQVVIPGHAIMGFYTDASIYKYFDSYAPFIKERKESFIQVFKYVMKQKTMTWEQINTLSLLCFKRPADEGMRGYEGKDFDFVSYHFLNSKENQLYTKVFEAIKIIEKDL
jgi:hypothetical protein